jgi:hypothetical protein
MATLIMRVAADDARVVCRGYLPNVTNCSAADDDAHSGVVLANFSGCVPLPAIERALNASSRFDEFGRLDQDRVAIFMDAPPGAGSRVPLHQATLNASSGEYHCHAEIKKMHVEACNISHVNWTKPEARSLWSTVEAAPHGVCYRLPRKHNGTAHWIIVDTRIHAAPSVGNTTKKNVTLVDASVYPTAACNQSTKLYELSFHSALGDCSPVGIRVNYSGAACSCASCGAAWTLAAFGELGACVDNVVSRKHNGTNITTTTTLVCKADRAGDGGKSKFDWVLLLVIVGVALALVALLVGVSVTRRRHAARESARYGALLPSQDEQPTSYGSTPQAAQPR